MNPPASPAEPLSLAGGPDALVERVGESLAQWLTKDGTARDVGSWNTPEWNVAAWLAYWQGAIPWLLARADEDSVQIDPAVRTRLESVDMLIRARTGRLLEDAAEVLASLSEKSIPSVPLKGLVLADRYYPDPRTRAMRDIDLMIHQTDYAAAAGILQSLGYRQLGNQPKSTVWVRGDVHPESWSPDHLRPLDLHTKSVDDIANLGIQLDTRLWSECDVDQLLEVPGVHVLKPAALFFHTALHASNNWVRRDPMLSHLRDLELLARGFDASSWARVQELANPRLARTIFPALAFLARYAPSAVPADVNASLRAATPPRLRTWVDRTGYGQLTRTSYDAADAAERVGSVLIARSRLVHGRREWQRFLAGVAFPEPEGILTSHKLADTRWWPVAYLQRRLQKAWRVALAAVRNRFPRHGQPGEGRSTRG